MDFLSVRYLRPSGEQCRASRCPNWGLWSTYQAGDGIFHLSSAKPLAKALATWVPWHWLPAPPLPAPTSPAFGSQSLGVLPSIATRGYLCFVLKFTVNVFIKRSPGLSIGPHHLAAMCCGACVRLPRPAPLPWANCPAERRLGALGAVAGPGDPPWLKQMLGRGRAWRLFSPAPASEGPETPVNPWRWVGCRGRWRVARGRCRGASAVWQVLRGRGEVVFGNLCEDCRQEAPRLAAGHLKGAHTAAGHSAWPCWLGSTSVASHLCWTPFPKDTDLGAGPKPGPFSGHRLKYTADLLAPHWKVQHRAEESGLV